MASREEIIELLKTAYSMELETVMNYLANSINLDGVRAEEIKKSACRRRRGGDATRPATGAAHQTVGRPGPRFGVGPNRQSTSTVGKDDRRGGRHRSGDRSGGSRVRHYNKIIKATDGEDYVTQDLCIRLLADEEEHLVLFRGFLKEYTNE